MAGRVMFAELHILSGERQENSDLIGVATSPTFSLFKRRRGQLFTVAEPSFHQTEGLCRRLVEAIENEYFRDSSRSVTSSLKDALATANEMLRIENARAAPDRQLRVGISCAAVRDDSVYVAQVAPANAFIMHGGSVKKLFSSYSIVADTSTNGTTHASDALGARLDPQVNFGYSPLAEGDLVVLATGAYWKLIPDRYIQDAARHLDPEMAASDLYNSYLAHARRPTTSLIVIKISEMPAGQHGNGNGKKSEDLSGPLERTELGAGQEPGHGRFGPGDAPPSRREKEEAPARPGASAPEEKPRGEGRGKEPKAPRAPEVAESSRVSLWDRLMQRLGRRQKAEVPLKAGPRLEQVGRSLVKIKEPRALARADRGSRLAWIGTLAFMIVLAALFVVAGATGLNLWRTWQLGDPVVLLQQAKEKQALATSAANETDARAQLAQAYDLFNRALRARDDDTTRATAALVLADLDRIDRVVRVDQAKVVVDLSPIADEKGEVTRLVLDGDSLYVLDEGLDRIFKYTLTPDGKGIQDPGKHPVLVKRGDKLEGSVVGDLLSVAWMPAGQLRTAPALVALESGRALVSADPKGALTRIEVGGSRQWGSIQAIDGFAGGLYLLDTKQKAVYYYPPTKGGYESEPYVIVDSKAKADLSKAVDIALDGNLYLLEGDGSVKRFTREGRPLDFAGQLPDGPIKEPRSLFASASTRSLYLVDGLGEKIVQYSPEGKIQRQFKADDKNVSFKDLRSVFVDEAGRKIYALARKSLLVFDTPPMP